MSLHSEILEQPDRLANLLTGQRKTIEQISRTIQAQEIRYVFLAARGTSDNAGRYANYLWGAFNRLPIALATPSLFTYYQQHPRLSNALVLGISQSGVSPDIVSVLEEGKRQGCLTLAITNSPDSQLAAAADLVLDIQAGPEKAVAATKTYTAELIALAMLSVAMRSDTPAWSEMEQVPGWVSQVLQTEELIAQMAPRYRYMNQCVVLGRGYNYATAFEWALKLKELCYVVAEPYSFADFQHGPIAVVERGFPVFAVVPDGAVFESLMSLVNSLHADHLAELVIISNMSRALSLAQSPLFLPHEIPEWLTPIVAIVAAQLFTYHLTHIKGYDPEKPRTIHKVTKTH
jgi:glutamine---fructose-6-phosphate transaminase (isomerizing)